MTSGFLETGLAVVIGPTGGIGAAIRDLLSERLDADRVIGLGRSSDPRLDMLDEHSIEQAAQSLKGRGQEIRLIFDATGALSWQGHQPEKSWRALDADAMARSFAINAIGPALIMKHFLPLLPREGKSVFATLSARVGSIGDNALGGWYSYRASKAALNQLVKCSAIELKRSRKDAICIALHPGTVATSLSEGFAKSGLEVQRPEQAAARLLGVIDGLSAVDTGSFRDHLGKPIEW